MTTSSSKFSGDTVVQLDGLDGVECANSIDIDRDTSQLIIDGQALVNSIGTSQVQANLARFLFQRPMLRNSWYSRTRWAKTYPAGIKLFGVVKKPEALPPTSYALRLHLPRCHYQVNVWENTHARPVVMDPESYRWRLYQDQYIPILMILEPVPKAWTDILACNCSYQYLTTMCRCKKNGLTCTKLCHRSRQCLNSLNA